jgi:type VI secretion system secreted protein VgrG
MSAFSQSSRMGRLSTALGEDVLVLQRFEGCDFLNGNFEYRVACLAGSPDIDFDALLGTHATVALSTRAGTDALFDLPHCGATNGYFTAKPLSISSRSCSPPMRRQAG